MQALTDHPNEIYYESLYPLLTNKKRDFSLLGYMDVSEEQLWEYLTMKKWRGAQEAMLIHEIVSDIFSTQIGDYMNYATVQAIQKGKQERVDKLTIEDYRDLF